jgi:hypothetical protein
MDHLDEVNHRGLHGKLGYKDIFEFARVELGLSEGSVYRRLSALKLSEEFPQVRESLATGKTTLSNVAELQTFFKKEERAGNALSVETKKDWLERAETLSSRELKTEIFAKASAPAQCELRERTRVISPEVVEIRIAVSPEFLRKIEKLKDYLSHALPGATTTEVIEKLVTDELTRQEKKRFSQFEKKEKKNDEGVASVRTPAPEETSSESSPEEISQKESTAETAGETANDPRAISAENKRMVWTHAQGQCEYRSPEGRRCTARRYLEIDHVQPVAHGGGSELGNLRLTCRLHNNQRVVLRR